MNGLPHLAAAAMSLFASVVMAGSLALANAPFSLDPAATVQAVTYDAATGQSLDIYTPTNAGAGPRDTLVFFYGGGWKYGRKEDYRFIGQAFAAHGYTVVIPDYRKYPAVRFPVFVEDGAEALAWVHDHIASYGGAPERIFLAGHSAGAHIAALLVADKHYLAAYHKSPRHVVRAFVGLSGPYDFTPDEPDYVAMFGPPSRYPLMQVPTFIVGDEPPMFLVYGDEDTIVGRVNLDKLAAKSHQKNGRVQSTVYPRLDHIGTVAALTWLNPGKQPVLNDMLNFLQKQGAAAR